MSHTAVINVARTEILKSGRRGNKPWTLYAVHGTYLDGSPLENVRTFDMLPVGSSEVTLDPYTSDDGPSYTAKLPRTESRNSNSRPKNTGDTEARLQALEDEVARLNKKLNYIIGNADIDLEGVA